MIHVVVHTIATISQHATARRSNDGAYAQDMFAGLANESFTSRIGCLRLDARDVAKLLSLGAAVQDVA
jgi:hypothetical protein